MRLGDSKKTKSPSIWLRDPSIGDVHTTTTVLCGSRDRWREGFFSLETFVKNSVVPMHDDAMHSSGRSLESLFLFAVVLSTRRKMSRSVAPFHE